MPQTTSPAVPADSADLHAMTARTADATDKLVALLLQSGTRLTEAEIRTLLDDHGQIHRLLGHVEGGKRAAAILTGGQL